MVWSTASVALSPSLNATPFSCSGGNGGDSLIGLKSYPSKPLVYVRRIGASRHLSFTWLPTQNGPVTRIEWEDLGLGIRDFAIDPSQDLMALVVAGLESDDNDGLDLVIALRSMSENKPHPNAAQAELRALVPFEVGTSFIQIVDDVIGVFFWVHDPGLIIFNWRTGKTVVRVTDRRIPTGLYDFAFLSSRAYMITVASGRGSIEIYAFSGDVEVTLSSQQQAQSAVQQVLPTQVAVLELPPVKPGKTVQRFTSHSGPFVGRRTPGRPFETSPDCKLHVMELSYGDQQTRFNLFVRNRYLLSYASPYIDSGETYTSVKKSWDEWGPDHARFLPIMGRFEWLRYVHGERVILPSLPIRRVTGTSSSARLMMTLDFNVHPKRLDDPVPFADESGATSFVQHNDVPLDSTLFEAPVVSRLPFVARLRELPAFDDGREYSGYMIDHEHLIGMRSSDDLDSTVQLDVYTF
ncbi:hypothetical protein BN946_scf184674.g6 [Trametes cinnabarina]|uniref:Uncharacterized protein n=1 Tax=Pycnoporus cinnabarinus TaxID=5643 RepID=A0A060T1A2_PYCCI|nr:hypothetical protein BN946_scf184674.g6 [Trametes cinnabarina]